MKIIVTIGIFVGLVAVLGSLGLVVFGALVYAEYDNKLIKETK